MCFLYTIYHHCELINGYQHWVTGYYIHFIQLIIVYVCVCVYIDWDTADVTDDFLLDTVSRFVLAALLKHCGLALQLIRLHQQDAAQFYRCFKCCCGRVN